MRVVPRRLTDRGQVSIEFMGFLPLLLLIGLAAIQLGLMSYAAQQAGTAARAAARMASIGDSPLSADQAGRAAMSDWLAKKSTFDRQESRDEVTVTARVTIPSIIPGINDFGEVKKRATMPVD